MSAPATVLHEAYTVDGYAAVTPSPGGMVLDLRHHRFDGAADLVGGAQILLGRVNDGDSFVRLVLDLEAVDGAGMVAAVWLDGPAITYLGQVLGELRHPRAVDQFEVGCYDDGIDPVYLGWEQPPDTARVLHVGRLVDGGPVYVGIDLTDTDGIAPSCWLDDAGLHALWEGACYLAINT